MTPAEWMIIGVRNLAVVGGLFASFRAGDNFGFHMGAEESSQCTCQWSPGYGVPYKGATRCEQDELDDREYNDTVYGDEARDDYLDLYPEMASDPY